MNFRLKQSSLIITWIHRILSNCGWDYVYCFLIAGLKDLIWQTNINAEDICKMVPQWSFWRDVWIEWAKCTFKQKPRHSLDQLLWCNSLIRLNGLPIINLKAIDKGLNYVNQLFTNFEFKTYYQIWEEFGTDFLNWLEYLSLKCAIPSMSYFTPQGSTDASSFTLDTFVDINKLVTFIYDYLLECDSQSKMYSCLSKIQKCVSEDISYETYFYYFKCLYKITKVTKVQDFQYHFLLYRIFTNYMLYKWQIVDSEMCNICGHEQTQTIKHLFWDCLYSQLIWNNTQNLFPGLKLDYKIVFSPVAAQNIKNVKYFLILFAKFFIYQQKCLGTKPTVMRFTKELKYMARIEHHNAISEKTKREVVLR